MMVKVCESLPRVIKIITTTRSVRLKYTEKMYV